MARQYHILVVEDEERWREDVFREALEDGGYQVVTSSSYDEAVAAMDRQVFDLVVIDVNLTNVSGNRDGVRVLERMATLGHRSQAIVVSGSKTWTVAEESVRKFYPVAFLDKTTFDVAEFVTLVSDALTEPARIPDRGAPCAGNG
jgi:DNA-binding NtrC family response regulator